MKGIKVEVNLDELIVGTRRNADGDEEPMDLVDVVLDHVAEALFKQWRQDTAGRDVYGGLHDRIRAIRDEEIREAVKPSIQEALTKAIQPTNYYGEAKGEPVTLHEHIVKEALAWMRQEDRDHYSRTKGMNPVQKFIAEEVQKAFNDEVKKAMDAAKAEVLAAVRAEASKVLSQTIAGLAGVK